MVPATQMATSPLRASHFIAYMTPVLPKAKDQGSEVSAS